MASSVANGSDHNSSNYGSPTEPIEPDEWDEEDLGSDDDQDMSDPPFDENELILELGRLYLKECSSYVLPVDYVERDRLDFQDSLLEAVTHQLLHHAPVERPKRIMDIGCGTGIWCERMGRRFPNAEVHGTDLWVVPTVTATFPTNVYFFKEDANNPNWGTETYSYIHSRMLLGCMPDFKAIIQRSFDYLEPGGWMESMELDSKLFCNDGTLTRENAFFEWCRMQNEAQMRLGKPLRIANKLKQWYIDCGFTDVHEEIYSIPINEWPKDARLKTLGRAWAQNISKNFGTFAYRAFKQAFDLDESKIEIMYNMPARKAIMDKNVHAFHKVVVVWGQKPLDAKMKRLPVIPKPTPSAEEAENNTFSPDQGGIEASS